MTETKRINHFEHNAFEAKEIAPRCSYYGVCGGCDLQNLAYEDQLIFKMKRLCTLLKDFPDALVQKIRPAPHIWNYRNRITLHREGKTWGFFKKKSHAIVEIRECAIASEAVNQRLAQTDFAALRKKDTHEIREDGLSEDNAHFGQVNTEMNVVLVGEVLAAIKGSKRQRILELFAGAGNFSLPLAALYPHVTAIEQNTAAVTLAEKKRREAGAKNLHLIKNDALTGVHDLLNQSLHFDTILCDPPRTGLGKSLIRAISGFTADKIILVSCDQETFVRDSTHLAQASYKLTTVIPIDMFPQTLHIEIMGIFMLDANHS